MEYSYLTAAAIALALTLIPKISKPGKLITTIFHEMGHALASIVTGGGVKGIRVRWDTSGDTGTMHRVGAGGYISRLLTLLAGYATPINLGIILSWLAFTPWVTVGVVTLLVVTGLALILIRNWFGFVALTAWAAALVALLYLVPQTIMPQSSMLLLFGLIILINGIKDVVVIARHAFTARVAEDRMSDFHILRQETHISAKVWYILFVATEAVAIVGFSLTLPMLQQTYAS